MKSIGRNLDKVDIQSFAEYMNKLSPRQRRDVEAGRILGVFEDLSTVTSDTFERGIMALRSGQTTKAGELLRTVTHELVHLAVAVKRIDPQAFANFWNSKDADAVKVNGVSKRSIIAGYASRDDNNNLIYDEEGNLQYDMDESGLGEELVAEFEAKITMEWSAYEELLKDGFKTRWLTTEPWDKYLKDNQRPNATGLET